MPSFINKLSFKKYINKFLNSKQFDKMIYSFATPEQPGYKYLYFFKEEDQAAAASFLKEGPTVFQVVSWALLNPTTLADHEVKPTRNDELKAFDIEISQWDENDNNPERWFKIKDLLFFIGKNFKEYRFF